MPIDTEGDAWIELTRPVEMRVGYANQPLEDRTFVIHVDARPLTKLIRDAALGQRVYELMSIDRPGELLHYLWVTVPDSSSWLAKATAKRYASQFRFRSPLGEVCQLAFTEFDAGFIYEGDDTEEDANLWFSFKETQEWRQYPSRLWSEIESVQKMLCKSTDYLVQHEIALMQQCAHRQDFSPEVRRYCELESKPVAAEVVPAEVFDCVVRLVQREDVRSVSCPFQDFGLWRALIAEQVRRSIAMGVAPEDALSLNGPDSGIPFVSVSNYRQDRDWGGEVHIPYEGAASGDLFIQPTWFGFSAEEARSAHARSHPVFGNYAVVGGKAWKYLLTRSQAIGELACATRTPVGDWVLYEVRQD